MGGVPVDSTVVVPRFEPTQFVVAALKSPLLALNASRSPRTTSYPVPPVTVVQNSAVSKPEFSTVSPGAPEGAAGGGLHPPPSVAVTEMLRIS